MVFLLRLILASVIGAAGGLGSVWLALTDPRFESAPSIGVWTLAASAADPYAVARDARSGRLPFGAAEGSHWSRGPTWPAASSTRDATTPSPARCRTPRCGRSP